MSWLYHLILIIIFFSPISFVSAQGGWGWSPHLMTLNPYYRPAYTMPSPQPMINNGPQYNPYAGAPQQPQYHPMFTPQPNPNPEGTFQKLYDETFKNYQKLEIEVETLKKQNIMLEKKYDSLVKNALSGKKTSNVRGSQSFNKHNQTDDFDDGEEENGDEEDEDDQGNFHAHKKNKKKDNNVDKQGYDLHIQLLQIIVKDIPTLKKNHTHNPSLHALMNEGKKICEKLMKNKPKSSYNDNSNEFNDDDTNNDPDNSQSNKSIVDQLCDKRNFTFSAFE
jgi:hypothetical protein